MRERRPVYGELSETEREKSLCRSYSNTLQARGHLVVQPCEKCGATAQKHHEDYADPRTVRWLCRPCHLRVHREALAG